MTREDNWVDAGAADDLARMPVHRLRLANVEVAVSVRDGIFGAVSNACNHVGGPLGEGDLDGDYLVCPWHQWKFHRRTGVGEPGFEKDCVPAFPVKVEGGRLLVNLGQPSPRRKSPHDPHPLARPVQREPGPVRVVGISTTVMDRNAPRYSTSDDLLESSLGAAAKQGCETRLIRLNSLDFEPCAGYYSKHARACTWPCSITLMKPADQLEQVYEALVHWADVAMISTPIRWGQASSLYFRMAERLNCVQNQVTTHNKVLIRNKVASFIIVGGQDNVQGVAGQMLGFFAELGFHFPQFPYIAHTRGWSAEDMPNNIASVRDSQELHEGAAELAARSIELARRLIDTAPEPHFVRGGRKAHPHQ